MDIDQAEDVGNDRGEAEIHRKRSEFDVARLGGEEVAEETRVGRCLACRVRDATGLSVDRRSFLSPGRHLLPRGSGPLLGKLGRLTQRSSVAGLSHEGHLVELDDGTGGHVEPDTPGRQRIRIRHCRQEAVVQCDRVVRTVESDSHRVPISRDGEIRRLPEAHRTTPRDLLQEHLL